MEEIKEPYFDFTIKNKTNSKKTISLFGDNLIKNFKEIYKDFSIDIARTVKGSTDKVNLDDIYKSALANALIVTLSSRKELFVDFCIFEYGVCVECYGDVDLSCNNPVYSLSVLSNRNTNLEFHLKENQIIEFTMTVNKIKL